MSRHHPPGTALHGPTTGARRGTALAALCALALALTVAITGAPAAHAAAPVRVIGPECLTCAMPKSSTLTRSTPLSTRNRLLGLISR